MLPGEFARTGAFKEAGCVPIPVRWKKIRPRARPFCLARYVDEPGMIGSREIVIVSLLGLLTTSSSIFGAALGLYVPLPKRMLASVLAFAAAPSSVRWPSNWRSKAPRNCISRASTPMLRGGSLAVASPSVPSSIISPHCFLTRRGRRPRKSNESFRSSAPTTSTMVRFSSVRAMQETHSTS